MMKLSPSRLVLLAVMAWMPLQASAGLLDDNEARKAILELRAKVDAVARELKAQIDNKSDRSRLVGLVNKHRNWSPVLIVRQEEPSWSPRELRCFLPVAVPEAPRFHVGLPRAQAAHTLEG